MLIEEIYDLDLVNYLQRQMYLALIGLLAPVDESRLNHYKTQFLVKREQANYYIDITLTPSDPAMTRVWLACHADRYLLQLDGWRHEYPLTGSGLSEVAFARSMAEELTALFAGNIRIHELRAGTQGYQWTRYDLIHDEWEERSTTKSLIYNFFGKRTTVEKYCKLF